MLQAPAASHQSREYPILDIVLALSKARHVRYILRELLPPQELVRSLEFVELNNKIILLSSVLMQSFINKIKANMQLAAEACFAQGLSQALVRWEAFQEEYLNDWFQKALLRNFQHETGTRDTNAYYALLNGKSCYHNFRGLIRDLLRAGKSTHTEERLKAIDLILVNMSEKSHSEIIYSMTPTAVTISIPEQTQVDVSKIIDRINTISKTIEDKHPPVKLMSHAFDHFKDVLEFNKKIMRQMFTEDRAVHLGRLIKEYCSDTKQDVPADVTRVVYTIKGIQPILTLNTESVSLFMSPIQCISDFLKPAFESFSGNSPFYMAYQPLANLILAFEELQQLILKVVEITENRFNNEKNEVMKRRYNERFEQTKLYRDAIQNFMQLPARFVMPVTEIINNFDRLADTLLQTSNAQGKLQSGITELRKIKDILEQKTIVIDLSKDTLEFAKKIKVVLDDEPFLVFPEERRRRDCLRQIRIYFLSISQSSLTEEQTNLSGILQEVENKITASKIDKQAIEECKDKDGATALLKQIVGWYRKRVARYQPQEPVRSHGPS